MTSARSLRLLGGTAAVALSAAAAPSMASPAPEGVDPSSMALADCPGEPGCPALVLLDETVVDNQKLRARASHRRVVKVFTAEGIDLYADVHLIETIGYEVVSDLSGRTILPDGRVVPLDRDDVKVKTAFRLGRERLRMRSARFPGVAPGAVLEHSYDLVDPRTSNYVRYRWDLQEAIPVLRKTLTLKSGEVQLGWVQQGLESFPLETAHPSPGVRRFAAVNLPSLPREPFPPPDGAIRATVHFYPSVGGAFVLPLLAGEIAREAGRFIRDDRAIGPKVSEIAPRDVPAQERMKALYRFVQERIGTEELRAGEISTERLQDAESADEVLRRGYGSEFERTMLFVAMARSAGLDVFLVLAADRRQGVFNPQLPTQLDLTSYLAGVKHDDRWSFFDPATRYCPYGTIAAHKEGGATNAMAVRPATPTTARPGAASPIDLSHVLLAIPHTAAARNVLMRDAVVRLAGDGSADVEVREQGAGQIDLDHRDAYGDLDEAGRLRTLSQKVREILPGAVVAEAAFEDLDSFEHPAAIRYRLAVRDLAVGVGGRMLLAPALFDAARANPFTEEGRRTPVHFPHTQKTIDTIAFEVPEGMHAAALPPDESLRDGPFSMTREIREEQGRLIVTRRLEIDTTSWPAEQYGRLRDFMEKVQQADRRTVVLESGAGSGSVEEEGS